MHDFNFRIFNEDRVIVESQKPEDLPLDIQMEAHIAADRTSIAYRKLLKEMGSAPNISAKSNRSGPRDFDIKQMKIRHL